MNFWGKGLFYCQMTCLPWRRDDTIVIIASIGRTDTALIVYASRFVGFPATTFLFLCVSLVLLFPYQALWAIDKIPLSCF